MKRLSNIKDIERRLRSSKIYHDWVRRNRGVCCLRCDTGLNLHCHHVVTLYHMLGAYWKVYGNEVSTYDHVLGLHQKDEVLSITLCDKCHDKQHPGKRAYTSYAPLVIEDWTVAPRSLGAALSQRKSLIRKGKPSEGTSLTPNMLNLAGFQVMLGLGWYIIGDKVEKRVITFNKRRFAEVIGKKAGTSASKTLELGLAQLLHSNVICGSDISGNDVEVHMCTSYLEQVQAKPWFFPLREVYTNRMSVLSLKWFLSWQKRKSNYRVSLVNLKRHLGITDKHPGRVLATLESSCEQISWADFSYAEEEGMCDFILRSHGATPIHSLRQQLDDVLER